MTFQPYRLECRDSSCNDPSGHDVGGGFAELVTNFPS